MALAGADHVVAVDPHMELHGGIPNSYGKMRENLNRFGLANNVSMLIAWSQVAMPLLLSLGAQFEFIFVDADHREPMVTHDMEWAQKLVESGGTIAAHDYANPQWPDMKTAVDRLFPDGPTRTADTLWIKEFR